MSKTHEDLTEGSHLVSGRLVGSRMPRLWLVDHTGAQHEVGASATKLVLFVYPATGVPDRDPAVDPAPGWDDIPGAAGCTGQALGYRDEYEAFIKTGFEVMGVSSQSASEQHDFVVRHSLQFPLLSDPSFSLATSLAVPTFSVGHRRFYKRMSLVILRQTIVSVEYPIASPFENARHVLSRLKGLLDDDRGSG